LICVFWFDSHRTLSQEKNKRQKGGGHAKVAVAHAAAAQLPAVSLAEPAAAAIPVAPAAILVAPVAPDRVKPLARVAKQQRGSKRKREETEDEAEETEDDEWVAESAEEQEPEEDSVAEESDPDAGEYHDFGDALPNDFEPVFPTATALETLLQEGSFTFLRLFEGARTDPGYPDGGWMCGEVCEVKRTKHFNCRVEYDMNMGARIGQLLVAGEYLRESSGRDDGEAKPGSWVVVRERGTVP
jgi:hypothetical protein